MPHDPTRPERRIAEEQQTFARPLRSLVARAPVTCAATVSVAQAAVTMHSTGVGSIVAVDAEGRPVGIATTRDVLRAVATEASARPLSEIMTRDPIALPAHAFAYEAAVTMVARGIRHVLVTEEGRLVGVVSERDLFSLQRLGFAELAMEIRLAGDIEMLASLAEEVRYLSRLLVYQGVAAEQLTLFVSVLNDRVSQRAVEIVRKRHDLGRIGWCWLAFGSEGRFEQTFSTDQDNGLLFVAHDGEPAAKARERLLPFAREVNEALDRCGYPLCKGNVMASNPELCLSLEEWKAKMSRWIEVSMPKALLDAAICFDFRALHGDETLVQSLREWIGGRVSGHPAFLRHLAEAAIQSRPALGRFGGLAPQDSLIDLKLSGARIFVDAARVYGLAMNVPQTNTADRLRAARERLGMHENDAAALVQAFYYIQGLRLRTQAAGQGRANAIDVRHLNRLEAVMLRESLKLAREVQSRLALDYQL